WRPSSTRAVVIASGSFTRPTLLRPGGSGVEIVASRCGRCPTTPGGGKDRARRNPVTVYRSDAMTPEPAPIARQPLSDRERDRLCLLARRYRIRRNTTLRSIGEVLFHPRVPRGTQLNMGKVFDLPPGKASQ